jgi:hypothetical protein
MENRTNYKKLLMVGTVVLVLPLVGCIEEGVGQPRERNPIEVYPAAILADLYGLPYQKGIEVVSTVDNVEVKSITLNRGNCEIKDTLRTRGVYTYKEAKSREELGFGEWEYQDDFTHWSKVTSDTDFSKNWTYRTKGYNLKYGEAKQHALSCDRILEIAVKTNLGEYKFGGE